MSKKAPIQSYEQYIGRKRLTLLVLIVLTVVVALIGVGMGSLYIPVLDVIKTIFGYGTQQMNTVVFGIRLPRVIAATLVGGILASSGAVMQSVLKNPLASASTLGVSQGAAFGATVGIIIFGGGTQLSTSAANAININNPYIVTLCAFIFGSFSTGIVIVLSRIKKDLGPSGLILAGVALSSLFSGGSALIQYFADDVQVAAVVFWTFGNLGGASWVQLGILTILFFISITYFMLNRWNYNAMESGGETAKSLGLNTNSIMLISMAVCTLASAASVAFVGIISFVGLIAPHIMRKFVGNDYRYLIPCSAVSGAALLILADTFGRMIVAPIILPIGAITSFLGAPMFLYLLFKGLNQNG